jgi:hypothetical protein
MILGGKKLFFDNPEKFPNSMNAKMLLWTIFDKEIYMESRP